MLIAAVGIYLWYNSTGAWQMFVESRAWHYQGHDMPWVATGWRKYVMNPDMTLVALGLVLLVVLGFVKHIRLPSQLVRDARVSLALYFAIPTAISVLGIYYNSYGWMALVPILLLLSRNFEWAISSLPRPATAALLILAACGLAAETSRLLLKNVRVARQAEAAVIALDKMACPDHPVATSPQHYYRLKGRHPRLGVVSSKWPLEVRESFLWIVDTPEMAPLTAQKLGGQWAEVARGDSFDAHRSIPHPSSSAHLAHCSDRQPSLDPGELGEVLTGRFGRLASQELITYASGITLETLFASVADALLAPGYSCAGDDFFSTLRRAHCLLA